MTRLCLLVPGVLLLLGGPLSRGQDKTDKYLTKDGKLTHKLVVRDLQSGFAGVTGRQWEIDPEGEWSLGRVFKGKVEAEKKGKVRPEDLKSLAGQLAKFDLDSLEGKKGKVGVNPKTVEVQWGKKSFTLTLNAGAALPKADTDSVEARLAGILDAVKKTTGEK